MPPVLSSAGRALVLTGALLLILSACGRRGPLEAPPDARAPAAATASAQPVEQDADGLPETVLPSATPTPPQSSRAARRNYTVPTEPFILDPLL